MIKLHKLSQDSFYLNCDLIERIESNPDTVITLVDGKALRVTESSDEIIRLIKDYKREIYSRNFE